MGISAVRPHREYRRNARNGKDPELQLQPDRLLQTTNLSRKRLGVEKVIKRMKASSALLSYQKFSHQLFKASSEELRELGKLRRSIRQATPSITVCCKTDCLTAYFSSFGCSPQSSDTSFAPQLQDARLPKHCLACCACVVCNGSSKSAWTNCMPPNANQKDTWFLASSTSANTRS